MKQRTILVTGVGRVGQLGEAVVRAFGAQGAKVIAIVYRHDEAADCLASLRGEGHDVTAFECDLTNADEVARVAAEVGALTGDRLDGLVNVAGGFEMSGPVRESDPGVWGRMFALNATTAYHATRFFLPMLRNAEGSIVYIGSVAALLESSAPEISAYAASKSAVLKLMRAVAEEERGVVRANAVAPTTIRTGDMVAMLGENAPNTVAREAVADTIAFLMSPEAQAVSGEVLRLQ
ncbi:SDR family NAD(P)-dependent oxidoreductase [bacterium]|nr:SDR family NAD(P)-dependent oxidoreductase [bacterium]